MSFIGTGETGQNRASFVDNQPINQANDWAQYPATQEVNFNGNNAINIGDLFATNITAVSKNVLDLQVQNNATINGTLNANGVLIQNGQLSNLTDLTFSNSSYPTNPRIDANGQGAGQGIIYVKDSTDGEGKLRIGNNGSNTGIALETSDAGLTGYLAVRNNATPNFPFVVDASQTDIVSVDANLSCSGIVKTNEIEVSGLTKTHAIDALGNITTTDNLTVGNNANITNECKCDKLIFQQFGQIEGKSISVNGGSQSGFLTTNNATNGVWLQRTQNLRLGTLVAGGTLLSCKTININATIVGASNITNDINFEQRQSNEPSTLHHIFLINNGAVFTQYLFRFIDTSGNLITTQGGSNTIVKMFNGGPTPYTTHPGAVLVGLQPGEAQLVEVLINNDTTNIYPMIVNVSF